MFLHRFVAILAIAFLALGGAVATAADEQAVIVHADVSGLQSKTLFDQLGALEEALSSAISSAKVGEYDGNEVGQGELVLYVYGPDAEKLFSTVSPILHKSGLVRTGVAVLRSGPPGSSSRSIPLSAQ